MPSLARSVPKPLKVPSLARSVPKPLKIPSLARSVAKPLKVPSLARSVPKPLLIELREAEGHQPGTYEPLLIFAADLLPSWSSAARYEYRLPKVNRPQRGTSTDSPNLIVVNEVRGTTLHS